MLRLVERKSDEYVVVDHTETAVGNVKFIKHTEVPQAVIDVLEKRFFVIADSVGWNWASWHFVRSPNYTLTLKEGGEIVAQLKEQRVTKSRRLFGLVIRTLEEEVRLEHAGQSFRIESECRRGLVRFRLESGDDGLVGSVRLEGARTYIVVADLSEALPLPVQVFLMWAALACGFRLKFASEEP